MFAGKYLKKKALYYYIDSSCFVSCQDIKKLKINIQLNCLNVKSYSDFLKSFLILKFLGRLKTVKTASKILLKKRLVNDFLSFLLTTKILFVKKFWSSSFNYCTELSLQFLFNLPVFKAIFLNFSDLIGTLVIVRLFCGLKNWFFNIYQSIEKY